LAQFVEIQIESGATFFTEIIINDANGSPKDLNGHTVRSQMRKSYYSTSATSFVMTVVDALQGLATMELDAQTTAGIRAGRYVYDVELVDDNTSEVTRIFEGIVTVLPNVTR